jgi:hypothetical protein
MQMDDRGQRIDELLHATQVGDTLRMRIQKAALSAEVRDRVSPILKPPPDGDGVPTLEGFAKDAAGEWDLDSVTGAKASPIVEIVVRRIASNI